MRYDRLGHPAWVRSGIGDAEGEGIGDAEGEGIGDAEGEGINGSTKGLG